MLNNGGESGPPCLIPDLSGNFNIENDDGCGFSLVAASWGHSSSWCAGLSLSRPLLLGSTGSRRTGSVVVAHGPSCSAACGIFPDQGSNSCPLHWQADSQPLRHQGSPLSKNLSISSRLSILLALSCL